MTMLRAGHKIISVISLSAHLAAFARLVTPEYAPRGADGDS